MKKLLLIIVLAIIAIATLPLWGSCDLNARACSAWCSARHYNSDLKTAACQARCTNDKLSCLAEKGADSLNGFIEELKK